MEQAADAEVKDAAAPLDQADASEEKEKGTHFR